MKHDYLCLCSNEKFHHLEFLVKVYPVPETLASVIPIWVTSEEDLRRIQTGAESDQGQNYQWGLYSLYYFRAIKYPWSHPLLSLTQYLLKLQVNSILSSPFSQNFPLLLFISGLVVRRVKCSHDTECSRC